MCGLYILFTHTPNHHHHKLSLLRCFRVDPKKRAEPKKALLQNNRFPLIQVLVLSQSVSVGKHQAFHWDIQAYVIMIMS